MNLSEKTKKVEKVSNAVLKIKNAIDLLNRFECFKNEIKEDFFIEFVKNECCSEDVSFEHLKTILNITEK